MKWSSVCFEHDPLTTVRLHNKVDLKKVAVDLRGEASCLPVSKFWTDLCSVV
jgi:hypothetical protein